MGLRTDLERFKNTYALWRDEELRLVGFPYSKGWAFQAKAFGGAWNVFENTEAKLTARQFARRYQRDAASYWLRTGSFGFPNLDHFVREILPYQTQPFVLITTDGDVTVPDEANPASVKAVLTHPLLSAWYSQNAVIRPDQNGKLQQIPIGLDLHTPRPAGMGSDLYRQFDEIAKNASVIDDRANKIFVDIHLNFSADLRQTVSERLKGNPNYAFLPGRVSQTALWEAYAAHKYVLSVVGNGLDCHRTWEALGLGCRVVTLKSEMDSLFEDLPVFIGEDLDHLDRPKLLSELRAHFEATPKPMRKVSFKDYF